MPDESTPQRETGGIRVAATQWIGGVLLVVGLLGLLRRHLDGFVDAPGASVLGMRATPLGHLVLFGLGCLGIAALRPGRLADRYLQIAAWVLCLLVVVGVALGGSAGDGLALNRGMVTMLVALLVVALVVLAVERRRRRVS